jgi:adenosylhomocysteine nucleosidase
MLSLSYYTLLHQIARLVLLCLVEGVHVSSRTLLVFAHADEAEAFAAAGVPHLVTGVGKIRATLELTAALASLSANPVERVIVLGTAGAVSDEARLDTVYQVSAVVQHDFSLPSPVLKPAGPIIAPSTAVIATGDIFVQSDSQRAALSALGASLVDMESYAYAAVCERLEVPLQLFKVPSDFADSSTTQDEWDSVAVPKSKQLFAFVQECLPELLSK